ncbi:uncharacterized protein F5147DRAFT_758487 [Suillus discolor]|uniref:Uncharacterized protein n=1 Tax=Suillus discolor TaxID=1912936 RepID=A0A9P7FEM9_9AGAM|nr:uncharacterized protein F5147DRAFT_758487 [Suillus discolor]KAG2116046.1 hypothetical protein F5147DRAFT_758487 [Suillus discolor]
MHRTGLVQYHWHWVPAHSRGQQKVLTPAFSNAAIRKLTLVFYDSAYKAKGKWDTAIESSKDGDAVIEVQNWMNHIHMLAEEVVAQMKVLLLAGYETTCISLTAAPPPPPAPQRILLESFAVVCTPKFSPYFGIFHLTDPPGLQTILDCNVKEAFHPHPEVPICTDADEGHVQMKDIPLEIHFWHLASVQSASVTPYMHMPSYQILRHLHVYVKHTRDVVNVFCAQSKPILGTKKKFQVLQRQVNAHEREVQHAIREKEARKKLKACQKKGAIMCPDGTAGRHFNLQHAMNLDGKDTMYKKIQYKIIEIAKDNGLHLETTIRYQPPTLLGTIITLAMLEIPYLTHFKDGWPVKDFLQQFLQNHANYRRRMGYDAPSSNKITLSIPNKSTQTHTSTGRAKLPVPAAHSDSDDSSETDPGSDEDLDSEEIGPGSEGGLPADIAELFKKRVEDFLKSKGHLAQTSAPTDTSQTTKGTKKSTKPKSQTATTSSKKIATATVARVGVSSKRVKPPVPVATQPEKLEKKPQPRPVQWKKEKAEVTQAAPSTHRHSRSPPPSPLPSFSFSPQDIPDTCPNEDCEDLVPSPPSPQLIHMFHSLAEHIHKEGEYGRTVLRITLHICSDIASENQLSEIRQQVAECGWPVSVNFVELNDFTWSLTADVAKILSDRSARASHIIWRTLLDRVTHHCRNKGVTEEEHLLAFTRDKGPATAFVNELSTTGFFGSKGEHIIGHALEAMFRTSTVPLDAI